MRERDGGGADGWHRRASTAASWRWASLGDHRDEYSTCTLFALRLSVLGLGLGQGCSTESALRMCLLARWRREGKGRAAYWTWKSMVDSPIGCLFSAIDALLAGGRLEVRRYPEALRPCHLCGLLWQDMSNIAQVTDGQGSIHQAKKRLCRGRGEKRRTRA